MSLGRIWACLLIVIGAWTTVSRADDGFKPIFDGKSLDGWDGDPSLWRVEEGAMVGQTTADKPIKANTFCIWRQGDVDDFELTAEYRITGGNSGIQYRSFELPKRHWGIGGYQADIDSGDTYSGILYGEHFRDILAGRGESTVVGDDHKPQVVGKVGDSAEIQAKISKDGWNSYHVTAKGFHFVHKINGVVTAECVDEDKSDRRRSGLVAIQLHAGNPMKIEFRNIRLKRLPLEGKKKLVLLAGEKSHRYGEHAYKAGCLLLKKRLDENVPGLETAVYENGWPTDPTAFDNADAVCIYADGGEGHPFNPHLDVIEALAKRGVGIGAMHYGVETPPGKPGDAFMRWMGGYFELNWSVNPKWALEQPRLAENHPVTRGVKPFIIMDEWYYHMRFRPKMEGVTAILTATPPASTLSRPDGPHEGNPAVRAEIGKPQDLMWVVERADGGRGFGYTGGHYHINWAHDDVRKLILNSLAWLAKVEVPAGGVDSKTPDVAELEANQDWPKPKNFKDDSWQKAIDEFRK